MSGFCGFQTGAPVLAADVLRALRSRGEGPARIERAGAWTLAICGSDAIWRCPETGHVAAGDVRLDARDELERQLGAPAPGDLALLTRAYARWGVDCVAHVAGDISAAIVDARDGSMFCFRDHFGVRPFFYSETPDGLAFSNTLTAVKAMARPGLDELFVADLLMFDGTYDQDRTAFAHVRRLPAGHRLTSSRGTTRVERYWSFPVDDPLRLRKQSDYLERFNELLGAAVRDRIRGSRLSLFLSGGLDSGTLAVTAAGQMGGDSIRGHCYVYDWLIPDDERGFAKSTADAARIPLRFHTADRFPLYEGWESADHILPEPVHQPFGRMAWLATLRDMASFGGQAFHGEGPDEMLRFEWRPYLRATIRKGRYADLARDLAGYVSRQKRLPGWRLWASRSSSPLRPDLPAWLEPSFAKRHGLADRWTHMLGADATRHPFRPSAYAALMDPRWPSLFESMDPGFTGVPLQVRHPFFDLRVARFLMSLPVLTWCRRKQILRDAGRALPPAVRTRAKTPLRGDPLLERVRLSGAPRATQSGELARFVDPSWRPPSGADASGTWPGLRPVSLSYWLNKQEAIA